jgi:hypothetical protein
MTSLSVIAMLIASSGSVYAASANVNHVFEGNDQAFSIMCSTGHGPFWVQKGQSNLTKCQYGDHKAVSMDIGNNFNIACRVYGGLYTFFIYGTHQGQQSIPLSGDYACYTNHV